MQKENTMKVKSIRSVGRKEVYDISVEGNQQYILENGIVSHNTGSYYGADNIWILGRQQDKDGTEIQGYHFVINVEKSRYVKEKSKIPITVSFDGGINKWSGLLELAVEAGIVVKPKTAGMLRLTRKPVNSARIIAHLRSIIIPIFGKTY